MQFYSIKKIKDRLGKKEKNNFTNTIKEDLLLMVIEAEVKFM